MLTDAFLVAAIAGRSAAMMASSISHIFNVFSVRFRAPWLQDSGVPTTASSRGHVGDGYIYTHYYITLDQRRVGHIRWELVISSRPLSASKISGCQRSGVYTRSVEKKEKGMSELVRNMQTVDAICTYQRDMVH